MWKKGEGEGGDEMEMPCSMGSVTVVPAPTPLWVVFTGERRKGKAEEKRQHLRTQICTALLVPYSREVRWRAGKGWKGEGTVRGGKRRETRKEEELET